MAEDASVDYVKTRLDIFRNLDEVVSHTNEELDKHFATAERALNDLDMLDQYPELLLEESRDLLIKCCKRLERFGDSVRAKASRVDKSGRKLSKIQLRECRGRRSCESEARSGDSGFIPSTHCTVDPVEEQTEIEKRKQGTEGLVTTTVNPLPAADSESVVWNNNVLSFGSLLKSSGGNETNV